MTSFPISKTAGIFWITPEQWSSYVDLCIDRAKLPPTYNDWMNVSERVNQSLAREGWEVIKINIDLAEFAAWCKLNGLETDKVARVKYANEIADAQIRTRDVQRIKAAI